MNPDLYLSRAFVEFGPFTAQEILLFSNRGILSPMDHIRQFPADEWSSIESWLTANASPSSPTPPPSKAAPPAKKAAPKKTAAKKAAKKAPGKS